MKNYNGGGTVYKLSGNRRKPYAARVTIGWTGEGKQVRKIIGYYTTQKEAKAALSDYLKTPYILETKDLLFKDLYEKWSERKFQNISKSALNNYKAGFRHAAALHEMKVKEIKLTHLQEIFDKTTLAIETQKHIKSFLNQIFRYALEHELVEKTYTDFIQLNKHDAAPKEKKEALTEDEIRLLWKQNHPVADIALVLLYTGFRINELFDVEKEHVHLDEGYIVGGFKSEAGTDRIVPIHSKIRHIIEHQMKFSNKYLFESKTGKRVSYTYFSQNNWKKFMKSINLDYTAHEFRHTFISRIDRTAANKVAVHRIIGHADTDVTARYTHKNLEDLIEAIEHLD